MADRDDQTAVRVSGGVIYEEMCVRSQVWQCGQVVRQAPSLPPLSNHGVNLWPPQ